MIARTDPSRLQGGGRPLGVVVQLGPGNPFGVVAAEEGDDAATVSGRCFDALGEGEHGRPTLGEGLGLRAFRAGYGIDLRVNAI